MKKDKNKIREPFPPENTPQPPQIKDPSARKEINDPESNEEKTAGKQKAVRPDGKPEPANKKGQQQ